MWQGIRLALSLLPLVAGPGCTIFREEGDPGDTAPFLFAAPEHILDLGSVRVDRLNHCVVAEGWVNQVEGLVEVLACGPGGKTHESILVLKTDPVDLHAALHLLGLRPGRMPPSRGWTAPVGPSVDIWVEWMVQGAPRRVRAERLVYNRREGRVLPVTVWTYTDPDGRGSASMLAKDDTLVATFQDPRAVFNLPLPCAADDELLFAHTAALPSLDTPVTVRFHPVTD